MKLMSCFLAFAIMGTSPAKAGCVKDADVTIQEFAFEGGSRIDALLALGKQANVCFGLRNLPQMAFLEPASFHFQKESPQHIAPAIFQNEESVQVSVAADGLIMISQPSRARSLFDHTIASFDVGRVTLQTMSVAIENKLKLELDPEIQGFAGSFPTGDRDDLVGPFHEAGRTVTELLNLVVSSSRGASWIALVPDNTVGETIPDNMWVVVQYNRPMSDYKTLLEAAGGKFASQPPR